MLSSAYPPIYAPNFSSICWVVTRVAFLIYNAFGQLCYYQVSCSFGPLPACLSFLAFVRAFVHAPAQNI